MRVSLALVLVVGLVWGAIAFFTQDENPYGPPAEQALATPAEFTTSFWDKTLGGDEEMTPERWAEFNDPTNSDLPAQDAQLLMTLGRNLTIADLKGVGRETWPQYWPNTNANALCSELNIVGASPMLLPVNNGATYAKILVAWEGVCIDGTEASSFNVSYVYAHKKGSSWVPVRDWEVPVDPSLETVAGLEPADYELKNLSNCGAASNEDIQARIIVANAWDLMCADAVKDGVKLEATSGYRDRVEQLELFNSAIKYYGSEKEAKRWVAPADEASCSSKHCDASAINVKSGKSLIWLNQVVGCSVNGEITMGKTSCEVGESSVKRLNLYGFSAPVPYVPTYLEFILPIETEKANPDCNPGNVSTPTMVAQIFRCRLDIAGITGESQDKIVAEALVVSRCESGWNPLALAFAGKFRNSPHPVSDMTYDQGGVFMLSAEESERLMTAGYKDVHNPVANINAAASLWLISQDWSSWGCATGAGELFEAGPELPQYGGPELPSWAKSY